jgi:hypothetical protein
MKTTYTVYRQTASWYDMPLHVQESCQHPMMVNFTGSLHQLSALPEAVLAWLDTLPNKPKTAWKPATYSRSVRSNVSNWHTNQAETVID